MKFTLEQSPYQRAMLASQDAYSAYDTPKEQSEPKEPPHRPRPTTTYRHKQRMKELQNKDKS